MFTNYDIIMLIVNLGSPLSLVDNVMDYDTLVSEFELY